MQTRKSPIALVVTSKDEIQGVGSVTRAIMPLASRCSISFATRSRIGMGSFRRGIRTGCTDSSIFKLTLPSSLP